MLPLKLAQSLALCKPALERPATKMILIFRAIPVTLDARQIAEIWLQALLSKTNDLIKSR